MASLDVTPRRPEQDPAIDMSMTIIATARHAMSRGGNAACIATGSFEALCDVAPLRSLTPREELFCEGDRRRDFYQVVSGALLQSRVRGNGSRQILHLALPSDFLSLPIEDRHNCDAHALGAAQVRCIPADAIRRAHLHGQGFLQTICRHLSADVVRLQTHVLILGRPSSIQRVAALLLDLLARQHQGADTALPYTMPLSRCDMGELLCISFESVSRAMSRLKRLGVVTMSDPRTIIAVKTEQLSRIASE